MMITSWKKKWIRFCSLTFRRNKPHQIEKPWVLVHLRRGPSLPQQGLQLLSLQNLIGSTRVSACAGVAPVWEPSLRKSGFYQLMDFLPHHHSRTQTHLQQRHDSLWQVMAPLMPVYVLSVRTACYIVRQTTIFVYQLQTRTVFPPTSSSAVLPSHETNQQLELQHPPR